MRNRLVLFHLTSARVSEQITRALEETEWLTLLIEQRIAYDDDGLKQE